MGEKGCSRKREKLRKKGTEEGKQGLQLSRSIDYIKGSIYIKGSKVARERKINSKDLEYQAKGVQTNLKQLGVTEIAEQRVTRSELFLNKD